MCGGTAKLISRHWKILFREPEGSLWNALELRQGWKTGTDLELLRTTQKLAGRTVFMVTMKSGNERAARFPRGIEKEKEPVVAKAKKTTKSFGTKAN